MKVKDVMVLDLTAVTPATTVSEAVHTMSNHRVSGLPVVDQEFEVVGFVSEKDVIGTAYPYADVDSEDLLITAPLADLVRELRTLGGRLVSDSMTEPALTVSENEDLDQVAATMLTRRLKVLPVVRDGRLVGIVRRRDIARALIEEGERH